MTILREMVLEDSFNFVIPLPKVNIWPNENQYTVNQKKLFSKTTIPGHFFKIYVLSSIF